MAAAQGEYILPIFPFQFNPIHCWVSDAGSLVESKWCHYVMFEADSYLKLLPPSILDIYKVFEHIDMLFIGIW